MRNLLIIYPHFPPSNLTGVHRPRLIANFIEEFGWHPVVLTVDSNFYEEPLDWDLVKTVKPHVEIYYTKARKVPKPRIYGDIGLRAFKFLKIRALEIITSKKIDFIWIPIPSFYVALLGRILYEKTGIPYGIDYIDPWVRDIHNRKNWRYVLSNAVARILEPYAVKKAALISSVSEEYFLPVIDRNFKNKPKPRTIAMPYGFDPDDYKAKPVKKIYPWQGKKCKVLMYAGAFLPNSGYFLQVLFKVVKSLKDNGLFDDFCFYFIGTGNYIHKSVEAYANEAGLNDVVFEIRQRFPYLNILDMLENSDGIIVLGSTERHYTASKIFQSLLSRKPIFAMFHHQSSTVRILEEANATNFLVKYFPGENEDDFYQQTKDIFLRFLQSPQDWNPDLKALDKYSARAGAKKLAQTLDKIVNENK